MENLEKFKEALGAEVGGTIDGRHWKCADCDAEGDAEDRPSPFPLGGLALFKHRQKARHWEDKDG